MSIMNVTKGDVLQGHIGTLLQALHKNEALILETPNIPAKRLIEIFKNQQDIGQTFQWLQNIQDARKAQKPAPTPGTAEVINDTLKDAVSNNLTAVK